MSDITGQVNDQEGRDIARQLLRAGAATFAAAPAYTLSDYSECLHRIAEREAKAEGVGSGVGDNRLLYAAMKDDTLSRISDLKDRLQLVRSYL